MDLSVYPEIMAVMFVIFLASVFTLNTLVFKPTLRVLKEREKRLAGMSGEAKSLEHKAQEKFAAYTKIMDEAKQAARGVRESILKTAETEQKQIITQARDGSEAQINEAKQIISTQTSEARLKLRQSSQDLAKTMVEKILKRKAA